MFVEMQKNGLPRRIGTFILVRLLDKKILILYAVMASRLIVCKIELEKFYGELSKLNHMLLYLVTATQRWV